MVEGGGVYARDKNTSATLCPRVKCCAATGLRNTTVIVAIYVVKIDMMRVAREGGGNVRKLLHNA